MIFLDSSYLIGLIIDNDVHHQKAHMLRPLLEHENKIINNTVLTEVLNSLKKNNYHWDRKKVIHSLLDIGVVSILSRNDYVDSIKLFNYYNHAINFSDCTILKTMQNNKVNKIVSFDSDFDKIKGIIRITH
ncbi:MAG: type II toxin-antitoxin system VapC family toxin [Methanosphaera sp.]|nr:type II toxin-antitoxin system VapC family toxin [Methanosphaera sp.]